MHLASRMAPDAKGTAPCNRSNEVIVGAGANQRDGFSRGDESKTYCNRQRIVEENIQSRSPTFERGR